MPKPLNMEKVEEGLREFVQMVDRLLHQRRMEAERPRPACAYNWSPEKTSVSKEWKLEVLPADLRPLLDIRRGKVKGKPERQFVNDLADWLQCSLKERNDLLLSLGYAPAEPFLEGEEYYQAIQAARRIMNYVPMPAYILTRDWTVQDWNDHILTFLGWTKATPLSLPPEQLNVLHLIFNPDLGLRPRLEISPDVWEQTAWRNVYGFINQNMLCRYDPWYQELVQRLHGLPDFPRVWNSVTQEAVPTFFRYMHIDFITQIIAPNGKLVGFHSLFICNGDLYYPQVATYMPADDASRQVFAELGLPVPENGWGYKQNLG